MAFHVACPITCRRICYCTLGFPQKLQSEKARNEFAEEVAKVVEFLRDPRSLGVRESGTVQIVVPKVVVSHPLPAVIGDGGVGGAVGGDGEELYLSAQTKRAAIQRKAAAASLEAEDLVRRFESGTLVDATNNVAGEEQDQSNAIVVCRLCFKGRTEGSEKSRKILSCKSCGKKYHRSCLKTWAQHRDLFHWSSWTCPSCRICEVCRRNGDPLKFMFCKRCDGAYHCYCQQPSHKNVSSGPYLCPKHTRCHSCGSTVPGNGLSVRWFLGYTSCDACGRLFVKGNYCPVCLKVYRDSEATPMVCCDICQRWVHCECDGISDEKYLQFQVDGNLQYRCATCRGECYQVTSPDDAVQELWRRRDAADKDLIANLRAAAGLPTQEEIFSISPYSDEDENGPITLKNEYSRALKFSLRGLADKSPKKFKEYGKKSSNKKYGKKKEHQTSLISKIEANQNFEGYSGPRSLGYSTGDDKNDAVQSHKSRESDLLSSPVAGSLTEGMCSVNQAGVLKHKFIDEVTTTNLCRASWTVQTDSNKSLGLDVGEDIGKSTSKSKTAKGPKLVIHLGVRNKNVTNSPKSDASSCQREHDLTTSNGSEDVGQQRVNGGQMDNHDVSATFGGGKGEKVDYSDQVKDPKFRGRGGNLIKIRKVGSGGSEMNPKIVDRYDSVSPVSTHVVLGKRSTEGSTAAFGTVTEPAVKSEKVSTMKHTEVIPDANADLDDKSKNSSGLQPLPKDSRPLLKLKFKKPYIENRSLWTAPVEDDKAFAKGQRSKRKRPVMEKTLAKEGGEASQWYEDDEIMDANWILQKLGKDAVGKRVEAHQPSDNSWHRGTVTEIFEGKSMVSVALDDGRSKNLELGKQGIRFVSQKQKR